MSSARSTAALDPRVPLGTPNGKAYLAGKQAAIAAATEAGFDSTTFTEIPVQWGEQVRPLRFHSVEDVVARQARPDPADAWSVSQPLGRALITVSPSCVPLPLPRQLQDANHHVNNATFFRYLEAGRGRYTAALAARVPKQAADDLEDKGTKKGLVVGSLTHNYLVSKFRSHTRRIRRWPISERDKTPTSHALTPPPPPESHPSHRP